MVLLWRKAPKIWKAKGYTLTTVADELEKEFGTGRKLGRGPISLLVKTQCEPCPPDVEAFIRERLPVKDQESWAEYLAKVASEPPEDDAPPVTLEQRDFRALAREAAVEVASTVRAWLETFGMFITFARAALSGIAAKLDATASSVSGLLGNLATTDAKLDAANGKLDSANAKLDTANAKLDALQAAVAEAAAKLDRMAASENRKGHLTWTLLGLGVLALLFASGISGLGASGSETINVTRPPSVANVVTGSTGIGFDLRTFLGAVLRLGKKVHENWVPKQPFPNQKLEKDCEPKLGEEAINGACWVKTVVPPPCELLFRSGNACYRPVAADPEKPVGLSPNVPDLQ